MTDTLRKRIEAKRAQAVEQLAGWRAQLQLAAAQVERWDAIQQACEELLADEGDAPNQAVPNPYAPPQADTKEAPPFA